MRVKGKVINLGLVTYPEVSLGEALDKARRNAALAEASIDPRAHVEDEPTPVKPTFAEAAEHVVTEDSKGWGDSHTRKVRGVLNNYALPAIGHKRVDEITSEDIVHMLGPIWVEINPTARELLAYLRHIFAWCKVTVPLKENPVTSEITDALPKVRHVPQHHPALPYHKVGGAIEVIRRSTADISTKLCLITGALTGCRPGETRKAKWSEIRCKEILSEPDWDDDEGWDPVDWDNLEDNSHKTIVWFIPADHTKKERPHRVPVASALLAVLQEAHEIRGARRDPSLIFPSRYGGTLNRNTLNQAFRKLDLPAVSYGSRSTFREWGSRAEVPFEVAELSIAHKLPPVVRAYVRGDLLKNRVRLMQAWSDCVEGKLPYEWNWTGETESNITKLQELLVASLQRADRAEARLEELEAQMRQQAA